MPERKSVTNKVVGAGKKVLATDAAQGVIGAVADKMEEIAVDKADDAAEIVKEKAARAGGRKPSSRRSGTTRKTGARKTGARKATTRKTRARKATTRKTGTRRTSAKRGSRTPRARKRS
jgi:topoisomerase IA-like protein